MKKNIFLMTILVALITFAYFWEQKKVKDLFIDKTTGEKVFNVNANNVIEFTFKNTKLLKDKKGWIIGELNYLADITKINFIIKTLEAVSVVKKLEDHAKPEEFFEYQDHAFRIKTYDKEIRFRLGDISPVTGYFYLEKFQNGKKQLYLVKDTNAYDGIYKDDVEAEFRKYLAFKNIITMEPMELISKSLVPMLKVEEVQKVTIDNKANRWFEINFQKNITSPLIYSSLEYHNLQMAFAKLWSMVTVEKFVEKKKNVLSQVLATIELSKTNNTYKIVLYGKFNDVTGLFATVEGENDLVYILNEKSKDLFFANVQTFWKKKINYGINLTQLSGFKFELGSQKQRYAFKVDDIENFEVKSDDPQVKSVKTANMNMLFNLILNLVEFKEAKYVTDNLSKGLKGTHFKMWIFEKELNIIFSQNSITVQNLTDKLEYFYPHNIASINIKGLSDFYTLN